VKGNGPFSLPIGVPAARQRRALAVIIQRVSERLERDRELAELDALAAAARAGPGRLAVIEAAAGLGRTRLLQAARESGRETGMQVAAALSLRS
jgi:hypothetical protein